MRLLFLIASVFVVGCASASAPAPAPTASAVSESNAVVTGEPVSKLEYSSASFEQRKWVKGRLLEAFREQGVNSITADACAKNVTLGFSSSSHSLAVNSAGGAKISPLFLMEIWSHAASKLKITESYDPKNAFPPKVTKSHCNRLYKAAVESAHNDITEYLRVES